MNNRVILPGATIGIIGGGQLGRMMALSAKASGFRVAVLDPKEDGPCAQVADTYIKGPYDDLGAMQKLAEISDVITYEFENIDVKALQWLEQYAYIPQGTRLLECTQNRITEKAAIEATGASVAPYAVISSVQDIYDNIERLGFPAVLKTARGGYDGKGQLVIRSESELALASKLVRGEQCVLEQWIPFEKEISVIVTRNGNGQMEVFPVGENIHQDNILHMTIVPARLPEYLAERAVELGKQLAEAFDLVGTLAVEMFVTPEGDIFVNELAPRPHNSGHFSIEACETSQFEQHVRAICNWSLGRTRLLSPAVMVNVLGEHLAHVQQIMYEEQDWKLHLYGKSEPVKKRKMGHITTLVQDVEAGIAKFEQSKIWNREKNLIGG